MLNYASQCFETQVGLARPPLLLSQSVRFPVAEPMETALVIDDDPDIAPLVDMALRRFHVRTETVYGGVDAIMRMRERSYDLVVLDLTMGDLHGFDVLRSLRQLPLNKDVPVLILTANGSHEAIARSFGHGADEFVQKPFDLREFGLRAFRLIRPFR